MTPTGLPKPLGGRVDALLELEGNWEQSSFTPKSYRHVVRAIQAEELAIYRAWMKFLAWYVKRHYDEGEFDVLIIDSAPLVLLCDC